MRVADTTLTAELAGNLQNQEAAIDALDDEMSSGNAIAAPSDDPVGTADSLNYSRQLALTNANSANAATAQGWLGVGNDTANSIITTLQSLQSLVLQALNSGTSTAQSYSSIAQQVQAAVPELVSDGNTTFGNTPIFAGTAGVSTPYSSTGTYSGNSTPFTISVDNGAPVAVTVPGDQIFGGGTSGVQSVFATINNIVTHLSAGPGSASYANLQSDLTALDANLSLAEGAASTLGESTTRVSAASSAAATTSTQLQSVLSNLDATNVPTVTAELQSDLTTYQAALYAVSQTVPESLAQYLK